MSQTVTKNMSTGTHEANVVTMARSGITRQVEDKEREGSCKGEPRNNIEWHKYHGWMEADEE